MTRLLADTTMHLAELNANSGIPFRNVVLGIIATCVILILAGRAAAAFAAESYGKLVTLILAGAVVLGFAVFPDSAESMLKGIFTSVFGG